MSALTLVILSDIRVNVTSTPNIRVSLH